MPHCRPRTAHTVQIAQPTEHGGTVSRVSETRSHGHDTIGNIEELHVDECEQDVEPGVVEASEERTVEGKRLRRFLGTDIDPGAVRGRGGARDQDVFQDEEDECS
jgi:hypothetical protein